MSRLIEFSLPYVLAGGVAVVGFLFAERIPPFPDALVAGAMTFGIVVAGFSATQRNMLLGMGATKIMRLMAKTGYDQDILAYLMQCVWAGLLVTAVSAGKFFTNEVNNPSGFAWSAWLAVWSGAFVLAILLIIRNEILMFLVIKRVMKERGKG